MRLISAGSLVRAQSGPPLPFSTFECGSPIDFLTSERPSVIALLVLPVSFLLLAPGFRVQTGLTFLRAVSIKYITNPIVAPQMSIKTSCGEAVREVTKD